LLLGPYREPLLLEGKKGRMVIGVSDMAEKPERRRAIRVCSLNFVNIDPGKENPVIHGLGRTLELNLEGATLEVADKLPVGAVIELELAMGEVITSLTGEVMNVHPSESGLFRVGIQFRKPSTVHLE
jgi:hypothetical protein